MNYMKPPPGREHIARIRTGRADLARLQGEQDRRDGFKPRPCCEVYREQYLAGYYGGSVVDLPV